MRQEVYILADVWIDRWPGQSKDKALKSPSEVAVKESLTDLRG